MTQQVKLTNYTDFDRMLISSNLLVTLIGAILAFVASFIPQTFIPLPFSPFGLSLTLGIMIAVICYTRNIASSILIIIVSVLGIISSNGEDVFFLLGYLQFLLIFGLILGIYADKLRLVLSWTRIFIIWGFIFSLIFVGMSLLSNPFADLYWDENIPLGIGGDQYRGTNYPLIEIAAIFGLVIMLLFASVALRGQITLDSQNKKKYIYFGAFLTILGYAISIVTIVMFNQKITYDQASGISSSAAHLWTMDNIFTHQSIHQYGVFVEPVNGYIIAAVTTMLTMIGLAFYAVGRHEGNIDGMKGHMSLVFIAAPLGTILFFGISSWWIQNIIAPNSFFTAVELFPIYFNIVWSTMILSSVVGLVFYGLFKLFFNK